MVTVYVPVGVFLKVSIVIVELPVVVTVLGEKLTDDLGGLPEALSETELLPLLAVAVTVSTPDRPRGIVIVETDVETLKSGVGWLTVTVTTVECGPAVVSVPVIVIW